MKIPKPNELREYDDQNGISEIASEVLTALQYMLDNRCEVSSLLPQLESLYARFTVFYKNLQDVSGRRPKEERTPKHVDSPSKLTSFSYKYITQYNKAQTMLSSVKILREQQKAYERQYHSAGEFPTEFKDSFWLKLFPEQFYENLCRIGEEFFCNEQEDTAARKIVVNGLKCDTKIFVDLCMEQPIPSMLLPALLTIYIADYGLHLKRKDAKSAELFWKGNRSIYTLLKYKRRPYKSDEIIELFDKIYALFEEYTGSTDKEKRVSKFPLQLPVVDWEKCVNWIARLNKITDKSKKDALRKEIYRLCASNGAGPYDNSRKDTICDDQELLRLSQKICKLLNTHTLLEGKCGITKKTQKIENMRLDFFKYIDPDFYNTWEFLRYADKGFNSWSYTWLSTLFSFEDMNALMLMHCFGITIDEGGRLLPKGIMGLRDFIDMLVIRIIHLLHVAYELSYYHYSLDYSGELSARICTDAYACAADILRQFQACDYHDLIRTANNLTWSGFQEFFLKFCAKYQLRSHDAEPEYTYQAYMASLKAIHIFMRQSIANYDNDAIKDRLFINKGL